MTGAAPGGITKAIQLLSFLYAALPSQLRLLLAESALSWAQKAKDQALSELAGGPRSPTGPDFTPITPHGCDSRPRSY